jgi:hypothetical protein
MNLNDPYRAMAYLAQYLVSSLETWSHPDEAHDMRQLLQKLIEWGTPA